MSTGTLAAIVVVGVVAGGLLVWRLGWQRTVLVGFVAALAVAPWRLLPAASVWHVGITDPTFVPTTYGVAVVVLLLSLLVHPPRSSAWWWYAIAVPAYLLLWMWLFWGGSPEQWSGVAHLCLAALALVAGSLLAPRVLRTPALERTLVVSVTLVVGLQLVVSAVQLMGLPLSLYADVSQYLADGRAIGTFDHPSTAGKVVALLQVPLFMATVSKDRITRRWAWVGLAIGLPATAVTLSRANVVAVVAAVFLWILLARREELGRQVKIISVAVVGVASVPVLALALTRFWSDPFGGSRPELLNAGLAQIARAPWTGTGPNAYVEVAGKFDPLIASGVPVHVSFLLSIAELGIVGALLFYSPLLWTIYRSVRLARSPGQAGVAARAFLVTVPGAVLMASTGWGMVADNVLMLWWFVLGYSSAMIAQAPRTDEFGPARLLEPEPRPSVPRPWRLRRGQDSDPGSEPAGVDEYGARRMA